MKLFRSSPFSPFLSAAALHAFILSCWDVWDAVEALQAAELAAFQADLPEVTPVPPLAKMMAEIDRMWDRVAAAESDATAVSMQLTTAFDLAEHFREAARLADVTDDMRPALIQAAGELDQVAETIKSGMRDSSAPNVARAHAMARVKVRCNDCHAKFRD